MQKHIIKAHSIDEYIDRLRSAYASPTRDSVQKTNKFEQELRLRASRVAKIRSLPPPFSDVLAKPVAYKPKKASVPVEQATADTPQSTKDPVTVVKLKVKKPKNSMRSMPYNGNPSHVTSSGFDGNSIPDWDFD